MSKLKKESLTITPEFLALPKAQRDQLWAIYFATYTDKPYEARVAKPKPQPLPQVEIVPVALPQPKPEVNQKEIQFMLANGWELDEIKLKFNI